MASDYEAIREQHLQDYGRKTSWRQSVLADRYSERTHFIYELLQNAEDAGATRVQFSLLEDRLEMRHDGRDFNPRDVVAICAIAESTKPDDEAMIGRFGIGFKSVYAYTVAPQVHCPASGEHFEIRNFVEPWPLDRRELADEWTTLFVLPFDRNELPSTEAAQEIRNRLETLSPRTVLFLRHLRQLEWSDAEGATGNLIRDQTEHASVRDVRLHHASGADEAAEEWLVFERPVSIAEGRLTNRVEIAFLLIRGDQNEERIAVTHNTELFAFFPTSRETHLGFLLQAPFVLTPARDNIRDGHPVNEHLAVEAGALLVEALEQLRDRDLLDVSALQCLPLDLDAFPAANVLRPLYDAVRQALLDERLLPTSDGRHLPARDTRLARGGGLRELLSPHQLGELLGQPGDIAWASPEISTARTPSLYRFLVGYRPPSWSDEQQVPPLVPSYELDLDAVLVRLTESFLAGQDDPWMTQLYRLLGEQRASTNDLRTRPIVRLEDGTHVPAFDADGHVQAWLPSGEETSFPTVRAAISADEGARTFLERLGLDEPDVVDDVMDSVLPRYVKPTAQEDRYPHDLARIAHALEVAKPEKRQRLLTELGGLRFLIGTNAGTGNRAWKTGASLFEPTPELVCFHAEDPSIWFLDEACLEHCEQWRAVGVHPDFDVKRRRSGYDGHVTVVDEHSNHERGRDGFDPDFFISGLDHALGNPTPERSRLAWRLLSRLQVPLRGKMERSRRQDYIPSSFYEEISPVGKTAATCAWLLDREGGWRRPDEISQEELDEGYRRDDVLAQGLGMRSSAKHEIAVALGLDEDLAEELLRDPDDLKDYLRSRRTARQEELDGDEASVSEDADGSTEGDAATLDVRSAFLEAFDRPGLIDLDEEEYANGQSTDPERRRLRTEQELADRQAAEPDTTERQIRVTRKTWEARNPVVREYLLSTYAGRCQICGMTFERRNGRPYFEARYLVPRIAARWVDHPGNALCLCATCFAKLLYGPVEGPDVVDQIENADPVGNDKFLAVAFMLCGEPVQLHFAQRHLIDLQALLAAGRDARTSSRD